MKKIIIFVAFLIIFLVVSISKKNAVEQKEKEQIEKEQSEREAYRVEKEAYLLERAASLEKEKLKPKEERLISHTYDLVQSRNKDSGNWSRWRPCSTDIKVTELKDGRFEIKIGYISYKVEFERANYDGTFAYKSGNTSFYANRTLSDIARGNGLHSELNVYTGGRPESYRLCKYAY